MKRLLEQMAEVIEGRDVDSTYPLVGFKGALLIAQRLIAQGFGHVQGFAEWLEKREGFRGMRYRASGVVDEYLASHSSSPSEPPLSPLELHQQLNKRRMSQAAVEPYALIADDVAAMERSLAFGSRMNSVQTAKHIADEIRHAAKENNGV